MSEHKRTVWLVWEISVLDKTQCLRAIDEDETTLKAHLRALRTEVEMAGRQSKFFTERAMTNHAFGHNDMKAASIVLRGVQP